MWQAQGCLQCHGKQVIYLNAHGEEWLGIYHSGRKMQTYREIH